MSQSVQAAIETPQPTEVGRYRLVAIDAQDVPIERAIDLPEDCTLEEIHGAVFLRVPHAQDLQQDKLSKFGPELVETLGRRVFVLSDDVDVVRLERIDP